MSTELHLNVTDRSGIRTGVPRSFAFEEGPVCLGRSRRNDVIFGDHRVSRIHLVIARDGAGWRLTCKGRLEPTFVNSAPVAEGARHTLEDGDVIRVGKCEIRVHVAATAQSGVPGAAPAAFAAPPAPASSRAERTQEFHPAAPKPGARSMDSTDPLW